MAENKDMNISYETLFEVLRREKYREDIQKLSDSFYSDVITYLTQKKSEATTSVQKFDLYSTTNHANAQNQLTNILKILIELYNRREKKILLLAVNRSRTGSKIIDTSNLLPEEKRFYDSIIAILEGFREDILKSMIMGNLPQIKTSTKEQIEQMASAAASDTLPEPNRSTESPVKNAHSSGSDDTLNVLKDKTSPVSKETHFAASDTISSEQGNSTTKEHPASKTDDEATTEPSDTVKKTVRFTHAVPKFVGKELEVYGPFQEEDVASLPSDIAELLIKKGRAEEMSS